MKFVLKDKPQKLSLAQIILEHADDAQDPSMTGRYLVSENGQIMLLVLGGWCTLLDYDLDIIYQGAISGLLVDAQDDILNCVLEETLQDFDNKFDSVSDFPIFQSIDVEEIVYSNKVDKRY